MSQYLPSLRQVLWFYLGLLVVVCGYALVIRAGVGAAPWDIFHLGVERQTGVQLRFVVQLTGVAIILLNMALGIRPTVGMVLNMLSVGPFLQFLRPLIAQPSTPVGQWAMLLAGIFVAGLGTALYVSADMGSGPRDGMMIGLTRKLGVPVGVVKNGMDIVVALVGWRLGGPLGLGTVVVALTLGPSVQFGMAVVARLATYSPFSSFVRPVVLKRG